MLLLLSDLDIAARTIGREAGGEPWQGKLAVAFVLVNRWKRTDGQFARDDTLASACLRHVQFSVWNAGDPNFRRLFEMSVGEVVYLDSLRAITTAVAGREIDPTRGSTHYCTVAAPKWAASWPPNWAQGHKPVAVIGGHQFFNDVR